MVVKKKSSKQTVEKAATKGQPVKSKTVTIVGKTFVAKTRIRRLPRPVAPAPEQ